MPGVRTAGINYTRQRWGTICKRRGPGLFPLVFRLCRFLGLPLHVAGIVSAAVLQGFGMVNDVTWTETARFTR